MEPTETLCTWEQELRPPLEEPLLGEVAEAIIWSDTWAEVPSLDSFSEPICLENRTNRQLSNVTARLRNMSIGDEIP
ncbi:unnamed protein product [Ectocarpus sp. CCAP 1310/34]|nr:unnamed protein product [Ectocarpus sp. CCAP 1310/34]